MSTWNAVNVKDAGSVAGPAQVLDASTSILKERTLSRSLAHWLNLPDRLLTQSGSAFN